MFVSALLLVDIEERETAKVGEDMPRVNKFSGSTLIISPRFAGLPDLTLFLFMLAITHLYLLGIM
jgi:hypothetical protein